ncbi:MAG: T9SS type A sorting domain-containing protein [Candidatus Cloacimonetes bacterium]|nr:T9SS type A sorting domain-containing protein [Candidatus Cloacimonadota bacterium]
MSRMIVLFLVIIGLIHSLWADVSNPLLAAAAGDEHFIYNPDRGIVRDGDEIYFTFYRMNIFAYAVTYTLLCYRSDDNGSYFEERFIGVWALSLNNAEAILERKYAPTIFRAEDGRLEIFFTNPENAKSQVAISDNNAVTFTIHDIEGLKPRCQYQLMNETGEMKFAALEEDSIFPLGKFSYFTEFEKSENDEYSDIDRNLFWGSQEYWGDVHSNDDIWIQQGTGGWPTFHGFVTTNGRIMDWATCQPAENTAPMEQIFLGGYQEFSGKLKLPLQADEVRNNGIILTGSGNHDVVRVQIDGPIAHIRYADWMTENETFTVYNSFPDAEHPSFSIGDSIWTNEIAVKELVWQDWTYDIQVINTSVFVECQLWIEGEVGSNMTWACADTVYITGDIYYNDIELGNPAEESTHLFGLISEERIIIKYKFKDQNGEIHAENCNGIYLYGCYAAIGDGDMDLYGPMNTHYEGIFSFEYQHPHGSTPGFTYVLPGGEEWQIMYPDLHKYIYPPSPYWSGDPGFLLHGNEPIINNNGYTTCGYPYEDPAYNDPLVPPYGTDWPWYNPVYPEISNPDMGERGILHLFGAIHQRRSGFTHRSGTDPLNHINNNNWDIEHWHYAGTHGTSGYERDFHYDTRLQSSAPPDYPQVGIYNMGQNYIAGSSKLSLYQFDDEMQSASEEASYAIDGDELRLIDSSYKDGKYAFLIIRTNYWNERQGLILVYENETWEILEIDTNPEYPESIDIMGEYYVIKDTGEIYIYNELGAHEPLWEIGDFSVFNDFTCTDGNILHYVNETENGYVYTMLETVSQNYYPYLGEYEFIFADLNTLNNPNLEILQNLNGEIVMQILDNDTQEAFTYQNIYLAAGDISEFITEAEEEELTAKSGLSIYPNPFNPVTNISFNLAKPGFVEIAIYNFKGQKVEMLAAKPFEQGNQQAIWDASLNSSGLYFLEFLLDGQIQTRQKITLLK